ncbi:MAG: hypothetical protein DYG92_14205, partial [Leptolyngbya sp. PLA1]|nr:hypothetical protein [Leptolyngbya sp. PLA1]
CDGVNDNRIADIVNLIAPEAVCAFDWKDGHAFQGAGETALWVRSVLHPVSAGELVQAWVVRLPSNPSQDEAAWECMVKHSDLSVLSTHDLTMHDCQPEPVTYRVYTDDSPVPGTPGLATRPDAGIDSECEMRAQLPQIDNCSGGNAGTPINDWRSLVTAESGDVLPWSPYGWINDVWYDPNENPQQGYPHCSDHAGAVTQTCGNNVRVVGLYGGLRKTLLGSGRVFDTPAPVLPGPIVDAVRDAAIVQALVAANEWHDRMAGFGFEEAAGNFQRQNFSGLGAGGDAMEVQVNINAGAYGTAAVAGLVPEDGPNPPVINLNYMDQPDPLADVSAALDRTVAFHEFTHAMSVRLHVGLLNRGSHAPGLFEGWGDYFAVALTARLGDDLNASYPVFSYPARKSATDRDQYYFGARLYPYSADFAKNPLTFGFTRTSAGSPPCEQQVYTYPEPKNPNVSTADRLDKYRLAEIWATTLIHARARLALDMGWSANDALMQMVVEGMKLDPPVANFIQARDAILQADLVRNGGVHQRRLWEGFAARGLGVNAASPPGNAVGSGAAAVCENFQLPPAGQVSLFLPDDLPVAVETCAATVLEVLAVSPNGVLTDLWARANPCGGGIDLDAAMTPGDPGFYSVTLRPGACRQSWDIRFEATASGTTSEWPGFPIIAGDVADQQFSMESGSGWTGSFSGAGRWERRDPVGGEVQPTRDAGVASTACWVTEDRLPGTPGASPGADDVDAPAPGVVLESPSIDVPQGTSAVVEYWVWYVSENAAATDVEVVVEWVRGGLGPVTIDTLSPASSAPRWQRRRVRVDDTLVSMGQGAKVRFSFIDQPPDSVLEGGVDDLRVVWVSGCQCCDGDYNRDGNQDQDDLEYLILAVAGGPNPTCTDLDFNHDGNADQDDVTALLHYVGGGGCP